MSDYNMISLGHNICLHIGFHQSIGRRPPAESSGHCCGNGSGGLLQSARTPRSSHRPPSASSPPAGSAPQPRHLETSSGAHTHLTRVDPVLAVLTPPSPPQSITASPEPHLQKHTVKTKNSETPQQWQESAHQQLRQSSNQAEGGASTKEGATGVPTLFPSPLTASFISVFSDRVIYLLVGGWMNECRDCWNRAILYAECIWRPCSFPLFILILWGSNGHMVARHAGISF